MLFSHHLIFQLAVEVPPLASVPFPPPLDEGMEEEVWREHVMTPPQSPQLEEQREVRNQYILHLTCKNCIQYLVYVEGVRVLANLGTI